MARRDLVDIRLITRRGNDWTRRYPLVAEAVNHLMVRSCLIDGEVVCCDERGLATSQLLRHRRNEPQRAGLGPPQGWLIHTIQKRREATSARYSRHVASWG